ncbi:Retrotransposon Copia-like, N-terminal [Dillenia turbinata]|uniref:Retrotransposon Copia-like, N-terminal n=1 Tax=Dillenia turbinata TaxID=194707 RepID=A0AAN8W6Z0_9MAGN
MAEILNKQTPTTETFAAQIGIKLDGTNYALWSQIVEMYILGKDKLGYINGDLPPPSQTDPTFRKWCTNNTIVKVYDLRCRVTHLRQSGGSLEKYYNNLQGLWHEIDFRRPNPMEYAYAQVHGEAIRQMVMITSNNTETPRAVLASKSIKSRQSTSFSTGSLSLSNGKSGMPSKSRTSSDGTKCSHCVVTTKPQLSLTPFVESSQGDVLLSDSGNNFSHQAIDSSAWILDSGATDHMTYDATDFSTTSPPRSTTIANANGAISSVTGAGIDILTKEIIGCGTRMGGSTTWMILVWVKHIMYIIKATPKNSRFGCGIAGWDTHYLVT